MTPTPNIEKNVISEVNRVREIMGLSLHTNSKNVNGVLIRESKSNSDHGIVYYIQVGVFGAKPPLEWLVKVKELDAPIKKIHIKGILYRYILKKSWTEYEGNLQLGIWAVSNTFPNAFIYAEKDGKRITVEQAKTIESGGDGDVGIEKEDIVDAEFDNIIFSDSLEGVKIPTFDPNEESKVYKCSMDGCAAYVKDVLGPYQGNAWHAHRMGNNIYSTFENAGTGNNEDMETLFNKINKNPQPTKGLSDARTIAKSLVPNQQKFSNLKLDDVVGLFYNPSEMHSTAFFEGMTGYDSEKGGPLAGGSLAGDGPFMVKTDGGDVWEPKHLGTDIEFKAGNTLSGGKSPGLNTHLGFVGAQVDGEPIIFHNIHKQVYATPLSQMSKGGTAIMWAKRGKGTTKKDVVSKGKGTMDKVKDEFMYYFNKIKSKL